MTKHEKRLSVDKPNKTNNITKYNLQFINFICLTKEKSFLFRKQQQQNKQTTTPKKTS
jgi:hypothetical protein